MLLSMLPERLSRKYTEWATGVAERLRGSGNVAVITHRNPDPDALGAAALAWSIASYYAHDACVLLPEGPSRPSKQLLSWVGWRPPECRLPDRGSRLDTIIVVDSSNPSQLGEYQALLPGATTLVVDHHQPGRLVYEASYAVHDPQAVSTSEIVAILAYRLGINVEAEIATLGLAGIYYDSRRFAQASPTTFTAAAILHSMGARVPEPLVRPSQGVAEFSERLARVKAASRGRIGRACKDIIVVVTHVGSFESSAARGLIDLGADVAVVLSDRGTEYRASIRLSRRALEKGVSASQIAEFLAQKYGGQGGGHHAAALAHLEPFVPSIEEAVDDVARRLPGKVSRLCTQR